uniref:SOWAHA-C winged helix-turn-helix domain-containing protein n=1 Tax=Scophthalmus maximus TaxID=52904 RepID=A0A8D3AAS8_SCOMX
VAAEFSQEAVASFVAARGGRVRSAELTGHFGAAFPDEPRRRAAARDAFKSCADDVAFVRAECGVKFVCLRRRFRRPRCSAGGRRGGTPRPGCGPPAAGAAGLGLHDGDEEQYDSGSEGNGTPKGSRKHFIRVMMDTSPQVRRSMVLRRSICLSSGGDGDSASLVSSTLEEDGTSVTLDPLEHEWMMCASDGEWGSLQRLLTAEPGLVLRKDFITGFTCLHWAAKLGKPELIALIFNFAKEQTIPISVDVRSSAGYTPLHIAAMHNHMEVVKLLVGAYSADVEVRDYSGRKPCQYLTDGVSVDIRDIIGAYEQSHSENAERRDRGPWRFSRVLQSNLKPLRLLHPGDGDSVDGQGPAREKPLRRMSSLSRMRPKLQRLRLRTSQIVHSTSFHSAEEVVAGSGDGPLKSRPKTHFFGWDQRGHDGSGHGE